MNRSFSAAALLVAGTLGALLGAAGAYIVLSDSADAGGEPATREAMIHGMGHEVMPFTLDATTHVFEMTSSGGIQDVVADDPGDSSEIAAIREHLSHEAMRFGMGDFSDPSSLHGPDMPGLRELSAGAAELQISYADIEAGGRITYVTSDPELITALHRWFGAQLSDHGADATYR
jgi:hypothetical protein